MKAQDTFEPETPGHDALAMILASQESCARVVAMTTTTFERMPLEWQHTALSIIHQVEAQYMHQSVEDTIRGRKFQSAKWQMYSMPDEWKLAMAEVLNEYLSKIKQ